MVLVNPLGPHQFTTCFGSVQADHTSSRGAFMIRVMNISRSAVGLFVSLFAAIQSILRREGFYSGELPVYQNSPHWHRPQRLLLFRTLPRYRVAFEMSVVFYFRKPRRLPLPEICE